jgi:ATP-binding cassette subfamily F protein 3
MIIVHLHDIVHHYGARQVLAGLDLEIQAGQKIGLVGANGTGKSTLLGIIAGEIRPDEGRVFCHKEIRVGYLRQTPNLDPARTVWETVLSADGDVIAAERELRRLEARLSDPAVSGDAGQLERTMVAYARAQDRFEDLDGYTPRPRGAAHTGPEGGAVRATDRRALGWPEKARGAGAAPRAGLRPLVAGRA